MEKLTTKQVSKRAELIESMINILMQGEFGIRPPMPRAEAENKILGWLREESKLKIVNAMAAAFSNIKL